MFRKKYILFFIFLIAISIVMLGCQKQYEKISVNNGEEKETVKERSSEEVTIDGITYINYKGPVQGEVKYQEGTSADENSLSRKAGGDIGSPYKTRLVVTNNYGHQEMFNKEVGLVKDEVGMEVLFRNLDVTTAYGGGFVNEINGLESGFTFYTGDERRKEDWFYWVNGILAPVGVGEYKPQPGDVIWWDYHDWSVTMFIPAVVGSYPQPFKNGFWGKINDTVVLYEEKFYNEAVSLKESLQGQGVKTVILNEYSHELLEDLDHYVIALGTWEELSKESDFLKTINKKNKLIGVYGKFTDQGLCAIDFKGQIIKTYEENAGFIYAHSPGINGLSPFWCITGVDESGVRQAVQLLIESPEKIQQMFSVVVTNDEIINCPYTE